MLINISSIRLIFGFGGHGASVYTSLGVSQHLYMVRFEVIQHFLMLMSILKRRSGIVALPKIKSIVLEINDMPFQMSFMPMLIDEIRLARIIAMWHDIRQWEIFLIEQEQPVDVLASLSQQSISQEYRHALYLRYFILQAPFTAISCALAASCQSAEYWRLHANFIHWRWAMGGISYLEMKIENQVKTYFILKSLKPYAHAYRSNANDKISL